MGASLPERRPSGLHAAGRSLLAILGVLSGAALSAQEPVEAVLAGQLLVGGVPADSGTVVLHRVTPEEAGPVDSVSVGAEGRFALTLPHLPVPGSGEVFFAAHRYEGIVYPGVPVEQPVALDSLYLVRAYPTRLAPAGGIAFPLFIREFWVEEAAVGWQVTDAIIVQNPSEVTYVADGVEGVVWRYPLPAGARAPTLIESGPTPGEVRVEGGEILARNPIAPGESFYMVQYGLDSLSVDLPLPGSVEIARVIVREPAPSISVEGLARQAPAELEFGTTYQQWVGQNLQDQLVRIRPGSEDGPSGAVWLTVGLAFLLVAAGVVAVGQGRIPLPAGAGGRAGAAGAGAGRARSRQAVLLEIARLDEARAASGSNDSGSESEYRRKRDALLEELGRGPGGAAGSG